MVIGKVAQLTKDDIIKPHVSPFAQKSQLLKEHMQRNHEIENMFHPASRNGSLNTSIMQVDRSSLGGADSALSNKFNTASKLTKSPGKKQPPSLLEVETDKLWGKILNEDYRKYKMETEKEKLAAIKKKVEL